MSFTKITTFYLAERKVLVETRMAAGHEVLHLEGQPMIEVNRDFVQLGCIRITPSALRALVAVLDSGQTGLIQEGNYRTKDPNTWRGKYNGESL